MTARVAVVGAGVAGALLARRLADAGAAVTVFTGPGPDATAVSGGLTRAYEPDPELCRLAAESLAELHADPDLARAAGFVETGSVYVLPGPAGPDVTGLAAVTVVDGADLPGWRGLPAGAVAVLERRSGHLSPDALRRHALAGLDLAPAPPDPTTPLDPTASPGSAVPAGYDAVVLATGRWTPRVLTAAGLPSPFRTKAVQYGLHPVAGWTPQPFVDETTGLWGRPYGAGTVLLGVPADRWDLDPDRPEPDPELVARSVRAARERFGVDVGAPVRVVAGADAYGDPPVLALRPVPGRPGLHTFTGGSGGAAKYALAASRAAATALLG